MAKHDKREPMTSVTGRHTWTWPSVLCGHMLTVFIGDELGDDRASNRLLAPIYDAPGHGNVLDAPPHCRGAHEAAPYKAFQAFEMH